LFTLPYLLTAVSYSIQIDYENQNKTNYSEGTLSKMMKVLDKNNET